MVIKLDPSQRRPSPSLNDATAANAASIIYVNAWKNRPTAPADKPLTANERTSITALIAYVAWKSGESEYRVERRLSDRFNIANMTCLPSDRFDDAIRYLVDGLEANI